MVGGMEMKRRVILFSLLAALILAAAGGAYAVHCRRQAERDAAVRQAVSAHSAVEAQLTQWQRQADQSRLVVTENGRQIGVYSLEELGLSQDAQAAIRAQFTDVDLLDAAGFAALPDEQKLAWCSAPRSVPADSLPLELSALTLDAVLRDLNAVPRREARDVSCYYSAGAYHIRSEADGTLLQEEPVRAHLAASLDGAALTASQPLTLSCEITDCDCYVHPVHTRSNTHFDWAAMLAEDVQALEIPVRFRDQTELLAAAPLLSVSSDGTVQVDQAALEAQLAQWAGQYTEQQVPFRFNAHIGGETEIDFLPVNYIPDTQALLDTLQTRLLLRDKTPVEAPMLCTDTSGKPFSLGESYIEVDIPNQHMVFYWDGELLADTDVVTGRVWGYATPTGLYAVETLDANCWLVGPDYTSYVQWWVGFYGAYGIHDASWRDEFGGEIYLTSGSHGCVNTPDEPMQIIHDTVTFGTPVLVH